MNTRHKCPKCNSKNKFTKYIDVETSLHINEYVGKCERIKKCGYHFTPRLYFEKNGLTKSLFTNLKHSTPTLKKTSYIDMSYLKKSMSNYANNNFVTFLLKIFDPDTVRQLIKDYKIGTSKYFNSSTVFWQIDNNNKIRSGKVILYKTLNGKKQKINWVHSILKLKDYNLRQCLFGLHLVSKDNKKPIAIVESEKTAIICSILLPEFIWLATGGLTNLKISNLRSLKNRKIVLFPDAGCFENWKNKVNTMPKSYDITISKILHKLSSEKEKYKDYDIADFLLSIMVKNIDISNCNL